MSFNTELASIRRGSGSHGGNEPPLPVSRHYQQLGASDDATTGHGSSGRGAAEESSELLMGPGGAGRSGNASGGGLSLGLGLGHRYAHLETQPNNGSSNNVNPDLFTDQDLLLDNQYYHNLRRRTCCWCIDVTWLAERMPESWRAWWRRMPLGRRRLISCALISAVLLSVAIIIGIAAGAEAKQLREAEAYRAWLSQQPSPPPPPAPPRPPSPPSPPPPFPNPPPSPLPPPSPFPPPPPSPSPPPSPPPPPPIDMLCAYSSLYLPRTVLPHLYDLQLEVAFDPHPRTATSGGAAQLPSGSPPPAPPLHTSGNSTSINRSLLGAESVVGVANISVSVSAPTLCVVLHAVGMQLANISYHWHGQEWSGHLLAPAAGDNSSDAAAAGSPYQQVVMHFDSPLPETPASDPGHLTMQFGYPLREVLDGFYKSTYKDESGNMHALVSTQLESIAARKAFPCFDEPALKAEFKYTLTTPPKLAVLTNSPATHQETLPDGRLLTEFAATPRMSTYLVAWVVGDLTSITTACEQPATPQGQPVQPVQVNVWATPEKAGQLDVALAVGCKALATYAAAFGVPYPLPKLDLVGIPNFSAGAMENWGLITYRESALLVDQAADDAQTMLWIATVVSHEISHQWFGNLVTMADWNELWINEGFASYFEDLAAQAYRPDYPYYKLYYLFSTSAALSYDTLPSVHALTRDLGARPFKSLADIDNMFDPVSYDKGGAVLRMLRAYLNRDKLGTGAQLTMRRRSLLTGAAGQAMGDITSRSDGLPLPLHSRSRELPRGSHEAADGSGFEGSVQSTVAAAESRLYTRLLRAHGEGHSSSPPDDTQTGPNDENAGSNDDEGTTEYHDQPPEGPDPPSPMAPPPVPAQLPPAASAPSPAPAAVDQPPRPTGEGQPPELLPPLPPSPAPPQPFAGNGTELAPPPPLAGNGTELAPPPPAAGNGTELAPPLPAAGNGTEPALPPPLAGNGTEPGPPPHSPPPALAQAPPPPWPQATPPPAVVPASDDFRFNASDYAHDPFLMGLRKYLDTYKYSTATYRQLWGALDNATGQPVSAWMNSWTLQPNYPVLHVSLAPRKRALPDNSSSSDASGAAEPDSGDTGGGSPRVLSVRQASVTGTRCNATTGRSLWWVPLSYLLPAAPHMAWSAFNSCATQVDLVPQPGAGQPPPAEPSYVLLNPGRYGLYRTNYSDELWDALAKAAVDPDAIPPTDLAGLLSDAYHLSNLGQLSPSVFISLTAPLGVRLRLEYAPWSIALGGLGGMQWLIRQAAALQAQPGGPSPAAGGSGSSGGTGNGSAPAAPNWTACSKQMAVFISKRLTEPLLVNLTHPGSTNTGLNFTVTPGEPIQLRILRPLALTAAGRAAVSAVGTGPRATQGLAELEPFRTAIDLLEDINEQSASSSGNPATPPSVHVDVRQAVYVLVGLSGAPLAYGTLKKMYEASTDATEKQRLLFALSQVPDARHISHTLEYSLDPHVPLQDVGALLGMVAGNGGAAFRMAWDFVLKRTDDLLARFGGNGTDTQSAASFSLGRELQGMARGLVNTARVAELQAWSARYPQLLDSDFMLTVNDSLARNRKWLAGGAREVCAWLGSQQLPP